MSLSSNNLKGFIPSELGNLTGPDTYSYHLDLSNNELSGPIPESFSNMRFSAIDLSYNQLSGTIPDLFSQVIDLSNNNLTGQLPKYLVGDHYAWGGTVNLSNNSLSGDLFTNMPVYFSRLVSLDVSGNYFSGSIESNVASYLVLRHLYLNNNQFTGPIPTELSSLPWLEILDLSYNHFTGPTPQWLLDMEIDLRVVDAFIDDFAPTVSIICPNCQYSYGGDLIIADSDGAAGESISFTGTATDSDGTITTTEWLIDGSVVATGLTPTISMSDGVASVTFKATDNDGNSSIATVEITVKEYIFSWPAPYNGITMEHNMRAYLGLELTNVGVWNTHDGEIYTCLRIFTDGLPASVDGISEFDVLFTMTSYSTFKFKLSEFRPFNVTGALNEFGELPTCSGKFETTTGLFTDILHAGLGYSSYSAVLTDPDKIILTIQGIEQLSDGTQESYEF